MKTYLVSFLDAEGALGLASALLDEGVQPEDMSVVMAESWAERLTDAGPLSVQRPLPGEDLVADLDGDGDEDYASTGDPGMDRSYDVNRGRPAPLYESEIGGGVSTSDPNDEVSAIEEMDDSETIAEEMTYPLGARDVRTHGPRSMSEINAEDYAARSGRRQSPTGVHGDEMGLSVGVLAALIPAVVPGLGVILGDGPLASDLLAEENLAIDEGIGRFLRNQGVEEKDISRAERTLDSDGAILEVAYASGEASRAQVERLIRQYADGTAISLDLI